MHDDLKWTVAGQTYEQYLDDMRKGSEELLRRVLAINSRIAMNECRNIDVRPTVQDVTEAVAISSGLSSEELTGQARHREASRARFALVALMFESRPDLSINRCAKVLGRDRDTIRNALNRARCLEEHDEAFASMMQSARSILQLARMMPDSEGKSGQNGQTQHPGSKGCAA